MSKNSTHFFSEGISFLLRNKKAIRLWVEETINNEKGRAGEINFIFCTDKYLLEKSRNYLKHSDLTDTITFDYSDNKGTSGDIFISIERVRENAKHYNAGFINELHRVMIHGILHLLGYKDKALAEKEAMKSKEDYYLSLRKF